MAKGSLKRGDARLFAQRFIVRGVRDGLSGNQILKNLQSARAAGISLGYRREVFYKDYNRYSAMPKLPSLTTLKNLPKNISLQYSIPIPTTKGHRWLYPVVLKGINNDTGETMEQMAAFVSPFPIDDLLLQSALENADFGADYNMNIDYNKTEILQPKEFNSKFI